MNKKQLYESIVNRISKQLKKTLNEGAGAGYTVTIKGLSATNAVVGNYGQIDGKDVAYFTAELNPGEVEWLAEGYYNSISSEGVYYDDQLVDEFPVEDHTIQGGNISGHVYLDDVEDYLKLDGKGSKQDVVTYIEDHLKEFEISYMYGGGWIHVNLPTPIVFEPNPKRREYPIEAESEYEYGPTFIDRIEIDAERVAGAINWFFENVDYFDKIYGDEMIEESKKFINEEKDLSQSEKMDLWHEGKREQNLKACSADKLKLNLAICKKKGYDVEAAKIEDEIKSRGLKESAINEGEAGDPEAHSPEFLELVQGIKDGSHEINTEKDAETMFDELVPGTGEAPTLGGELLRAAERIAYRYWNDGDMAGVGYGRETVNPAIRFMYGNIYDHTMDNPLWRLVKKFKGWVDYGNVESDITDKEYEEYTMRLLRETVRYIAVKDMWKISNNQDMWDYKDKELDVDRDDWDEDDW